ncbi:MAG: pyridoxal kinase [Clostridia bacterium]|nr:pyridoxal kinase [Clostridia bacterium]
MTRPVIGTIQSHVIEGYVGNSAGVPTIQLLGGDAVAVPTVIYTAHGATQGVKGAPVPEEILDFSLEALMNLKPDWVVTGFMGTSVNVDIVARQLARHRDIPLMVDPIIGDFPKGCYIPEEVARDIKERLVPLAKVLTPNCFEAGYLTGRQINSLTDVPQVVQDLLAMGPRYVLITSVLPGEGVLHNIAATREKIQVIETRLISGYVHGSGDMLNAALVTLLALGYSWEEAAPLATAIVTQGVEIGLKQGKDTVDPFPAICHDGYRWPLTRNQKEFFLNQAGLTVKEL